jgi:hypothetical protein
MDTTFFMNKIGFFLLVIGIFSGITSLAQPQIYTSTNNRTGSWDDDGIWSKSQTWMGNNPGTSLNSTSIEVYGKVTRNGSLSNGGSTVFNLYDTLTVNGTFTNNSVVNIAVNSLLVVTDWSGTGASTTDIYGTVIVRGNLTSDTNIRVRAGGLLIVLGDLNASNSGNSVITNEGNTVIVGQVSSGADITTGGSLYIYDDTPTFINGGSVNGTNYTNSPSNAATLTSMIPTEASIPSWLQAILTSLGVTCGASNTIGYDQFICTNIIPAQLTGNAVTGLGTTSYAWESSTTSASTGFANAAGTLAQRTGQNYTAN